MPSLLEAWLPQGVTLHLASQRTFSNGFKYTAVSSGYFDIIFLYLHVPNNKGKLFIQNRKQREACRRFLPGGKGPGAACFPRGLSAKRARMGIGCPGPAVPPFRAVPATPGAPAGARACCPAVRAAFFSTSSLAPRPGLCEPVPGMLHAWRGHRLVPKAVGMLTVAVPAPTRDGGQEWGGHGAAPAPSSCQPQHIANISPEPAIGGL